MSKFPARGCSGEQAWELLKAIFPGITEHTRKCVLTFEVGEVVIAEIEAYPELGAPETVTRKYRLHEIADD